MQQLLARDVGAARTLARPQHHVLARHALLTLGAGDHYGVRVGQAPVAAQQCDAHLRKDCLHAQMHGADVGLLVGGKGAVVDGGQVVDAQAAVVLQAVDKVKRGVEQVLGVAPPVGARAARRVLLHDGHALARGREHGRAVPIRVPAADVDNVVVVCCHDRSSRIRFACNLIVHDVFVFGKSLFAGKT